MTLDEARRLIREKVTPAHQAQADFMVDALASGMVPKECEGGVQAALTEAHEVVALLKQPADHEEIAQVIDEALSASTGREWTHRTPATATMRALDRDPQPNKLLAKLQGAKQ